MMGTKELALTRFKTHCIPTSIGRSTATSNCKSSTVLWIAWEVDFGAT